MKKIDRELEQDLLDLLKKYSEQKDFSPGEFVSKLVCISDSQDKYQELRAIPETTDTRIIKTIDIGEARAFFMQKFVVNSFIQFYLH